MMKGGTTADVRSMNRDERKTPAYKRGTIKGHTYAQIVRREKNSVESEMGVLHHHYTIISLSRNNPTLLVIEQLFLFVSLLAPVQPTSRIKVLDDTRGKEIITV
jgi:hypothetical protein